VILKKNIKKMFYKNKLGIYEKTKLSKKKTERILKINSVFF